MRKVILFTALTLGAMLSATAQNSVYQSTIGAVMGASGAYEIVDPSTVIAVDITVEKEQNIVGPYARYAQKYLDTRGSLVEKVTYNITDVKLSLVADAQLFAPTELPAERVEILSHNGSTTEFAKILPDRLDNTTQSRRCYGCCTADFRYPQASYGTYYGRGRRECLWCRLEGCPRSPRQAGDRPVGAVLRQEYHHNDNRTLLHSH